MIEGDVFRIIVPLDDGYSYDFEIGGETDTKLTQKLTRTEQIILSAMKENPQITLAQLAKQAEISVGGVWYSIRGLKEKGILGRTGSNRNGRWEIHLE